MIDEVDGCEQYLFIDCFFGYYQVAIVQEYK